MTEMRSMVADGRYARHLQNALAGGSGSRLATARDSMLLSRGRRLSSEPDRLMVDRVAHLNLAVIDRLAPVPASSAVRTPFGLRVRDRLLRIGAASDGFSASTS
jgi:hypothetical protein